jgi:hypothetical protein
VIVWLNGTFGCGKTTAASELRSLIPSSRLFDPETVGYRRSLLVPTLSRYSLACAKLGSECSMFCSMLMTKYCASASRAHLKPRHGG